MFGKSDNLQEQGLFELGFEALNRLIGILIENVGEYSWWKIKHDQSYEEWRTYKMNSIY